ncbi:sensor histidine kinase [Calditrichota bacterium LG25]
MKTILKSLFGKIALIFLIQILALSAIQMYLSLTCTFDYYYEKDQKLHAKTAAALARMIEERVKAGCSLTTITNDTQNLTLLNPDAHIYIVDQAGRILQTLTDSSEIKRKKIDVQPILEFVVAKDQSLKEAVFVDNPLDPDGKVIFSASPLHLDDQEAYLLITYNVPLNTLSLQSIMDSGVLQNTALAAMLAVMFSLFAGFLVFFFLNKRLQIMRNVVNFFKNGKYDARIPITSRDEIGELGVAFNNMASAFETYLRDLERNDRMRREFIANISHDLRSPLASTRGYVETLMIKDEKLSQKERKKFLKIIHKNVVHLSELVSELFELAKFDAKEIEPAIEPFSIAELAQDIVLKFQPQSENLNINLISRFPKNLPLVMGDIGMIERAISNLIQNALKFSGKGATVNVELLKAENHVIVKIADNGPGIPVEDLPYVFERFYRVDKSRNRKSGGSGLGLAIVKKIVEAHGQKISVRCNPGSETVFSFTLPVWKKDLSQQRNKIKQTISSPEKS